MADEEIRPKKRSGRWGDRPLGRGELRVYGLKLIQRIIASS
jgi:hypothetical protein